MELNITEKEKIKRFGQDRLMFDAVKKVLEDVLTRSSKDRDVQNLAARFLAVELVREAWKELNLYKDIEEDVKESALNVGL